MKFLLTAFVLAGEISLQAGSPWAVLWAGPGILIASLMIAWGAEATQFFLAQGIALAVLALLQTLPEFAVEAVLAWHREVPYLFASLTGALMLLTGLGWPMIYFSAATAYRREHKRPMRLIRLDPQQAVQIVSLFAGIAYQMVVWWKGSLNIFDGVVLVSIYAAYLWIMSRLPPEEAETLDEISGVPKMIVLASKPLRIAAILGLFIVGGAAVFLVADPFLAGLFRTLRAAGHIEVPVHSMDRATGFRSAGGNLRVLLGAGPEEGFHRAHESGIEQHQPMDAAGRASARGAVGEHGPHYRRFRWTRRRAATCC